MTLTGSPKALSRVDDMVTGWQGGRGAGYARRAREGRSLRARGTSRARAAAPVTRPFGKRHNGYLLYIPTYAYVHRYLTSGLQPWRWQHVIYVIGWYSWCADHYAGGTRRGRLHLGLGDPVSRTRHSARRVRRHEAWLEPHRCSAVNMGEANRGCESWQHSVTFIEFFLTRS